MRKSMNERKSFLSKSKQILAATLAFALVASSNTWAGLNGIFATKVGETENYALGDVNGDGAADLKDTVIILQGALNIKQLNEQEAKAADLTGDGKVTLDDALKSLQVALAIATVPPATPTAPIFTIPPKDTITTPPAATPKTTFAYVSPNALSVVTGETLAVAEDSDEYNSSFIENYNDTEGMYAFYNNNDNEESNGMKVDNPLAGRKDFAETVVSATSLEAEEGKVNVWTLTGASLEPLPPLSEYPKDADTRVTTDFNEEEVTYTIPEWKKGLTVSFWAKVSQKNGNADPILTFTDGDFILSIRANGSVKFFDSKDGENQYDMGSSKIDPLGTGGEWNYYTVTIANDWIQVYVNGQENVFDSTKMLRSAMKTFNGGFLTRMNPVGLATEEMVNANERNHYYLTKIDATSTNLIKRAAWYLDTATGEYRAHDEFSVFYNARFRGGNGNGTLLMKYLTQSSTQMFIGGVETSLDNGAAAYLFKEGAVFSDLQYYMQELDAEQVASNYELVAKAQKPSDDVAYPGENPNKNDPTVTPEPLEPVTGATVVALRKNGLGVNATYDETNNIYTFSEAKADIDDKVVGVRLENPFASVKNVDDKSYLKETLAESLEGQTLFPYMYPEDYADTTLAGKYVAKSQNSEDWLGHGGCDRFSVEPHYGNFYDKYYGDVYKYGNEMDIPTANLDAKTIKSYEEVSNEAATVTEYQRPDWSKGATISFWAKPTKVDDSPLITFYASNKMLLSVDTMGSVCYMSLYAPGDVTKPNCGDWEDGKVFKSNGKPRNTFATYGDASYVHANEWNYYTITFANDWIQVYVNGEEMVYKLVNLNRNEVKYFNGSYMTRYNTVGIWTTDMIAKYGDPSGKTLEGKERNYLTKSGYLWDLSAGLEMEGVNKSADSASIRANNVYENPLAGHEGSELLMDLMTLNSAQLYLGGIDGALKAENQFFFSTLAISEEDIATGTVKTKPLSYVKEDVLQGDAKEQYPIYVDNENAVVVSADTEGAIALGIKDYQGNDIYVSEACNIVPANEDGSQPTGSYALGRNTDVETSSSRRKIYSSDHTLSAGTQIADIETYYSELSAEDVKKVYETKKDSVPSESTASSDAE